MSEKSHRNALQPDYELLWYKVKRVLGQGAFGITYLANDINLDRLVAIKEYMPGNLAMRESNLGIEPLSEDHLEEFKWGLERFISEGRTLTKFEHPNLIRVFNVFEANNTAYMVMNYEIGESLQQILKRNQKLNEADLIKILLPLMSGLETMHAKGFIHRDIKPGNIFIRKDGSPVLLDFGSARQALHEQPQTLTSFVSPGYAPIEQYASKSDKQGPWTDIYGLGATLYRAITNTSPTTAVDRSEMLSQDMEDTYVGISKIAAQGEFSEQFLAAIDHALEFKAQERPQSIGEWREEFNFSEDDIETIPISSIKQDVEDESTIKIDSSDNTSKIFNQQPEEKTIKVKSKEKDLSIASLISSIPALLKRKGLIISFMSVFIVIFGFIFLSGDGDVKPQNETKKFFTDSIIDDPVDRQQQIVESIDTGDTDIKSEDEIGLGNENGVQKLLANAKKDLNDLRLTSPAGNNAFEKYKQVLKIDPENEDALNGMQSIANKYVRLAHSNMESEKFDRAKYYLNKAEQIAPGSENIQAAQNKLQAKLQEKKDKEQQEQIVQTEDATTAESSSEEEATEGETTEDESSDGFMSGVKDWLKKDIEKNKDIDMEDTSSEKVKRVLGGQ